MSIVANYYLDDWNARKRRRHGSAPRPGTAASADAAYGQAAGWQAMAPRLLLHLQQRRHLLRAASRRMGGDIMKSDTYTAPAIWASALVNGDYSGLDAADTLACRAWQEGILPAKVVSCRRRTAFHLELPPLRRFVRWR